MGHPFFQTDFYMRTLKLDPQGLPNDDMQKTPTLGFKEWFFLAIILFFGFSGFSVCVDKIYSEQERKEIESVSIHQKAVTVTMARPPLSDQQGYEVN